MKESAYFKDETMTGNTAHTLLKCYKDEPEIHGPGHVDENPNDVP